MHISIGRTVSSGFGWLGKIARHYCQSTNTDYSTNVKDMMIA